MKLNKRNGNDCQIEFDSFRLLFFITFRPVRVWTFFNIHICVVIYITLVSHFSVDEKHLNIRQTIFWCPKINACPIFRISYISMKKTVVAQTERYKSYPVPFWTCFFRFWSRRYSMCSAKKPSAFVVTDDRVLLQESIWFFYERSSMKQCSGKITLSKTCIWTTSTKDQNQPTNLIPITANNSFSKFLSIFNGLTRIINL